MSGKTDEKRRRAACRAVLRILQGYRERFGAGGWLRRKAFGDVRPFWAQQVALSWCERHGFAERRELAGEVHWRAVDGATVGALSELQRRMLREERREAALVILDSIGRFEGALKELGL